MRSLQLTLCVLFGLLSACGTRGSIGDAGVGDGGAANDAGSASDGGSLDAGAQAPDGGVPASDAGIFGALLDGGGASFRVWAPNAQSVAAQGDFGSVALAAVGDGTWEGGVATASAGQQYSYSIESGGKQLTRTDPRALQVGADPGGHEPEGILIEPAGFAWTASAFVPPSVSHAVIYELHVATFNDPAANGTGTFQTVAAKLADLASLGVNVIELMPVAEFPGSYSWGYNPIYPFAPSRAYGAPADLQSLIDAAHQAGLAVILDVVFNHFSIDSSRTPSLSMWCFDGPCDGGGIYFSPEPETPWGPRPAFGNPEVHQLILDALRSWQLRYRVDGFRWDSVMYTRRTTGDSTGVNIPEGARLLKDVNVAVHALDANAITVGEDLAGWAPITEPVDPANIDVYDSGYGFDGQWDDSFFSTLKNLLVPSSDASRDVTTLSSALTSGTPMARVVYSEDHDQVAPQNGTDNQRLPALIGLDQNAYWAKRRCGLGLAMVLTAPAIPMLFMGQEFLESLPFPFSAGQAINWTNQQTYAGFQQMIHDLIALRNGSTARVAGLQGKNIKILQAANQHAGATSPAIAFQRWDSGGAGDDVVVAANFSNVQLALAVGFPAAGAWHVRFNSDLQIYSPEFGNTPSTDVQASGGALDGEPQSGTVNLGPYSVVILSQ